MVLPGIAALPAAGLRTSADEAHRQRMPAAIASTKTVIVAVIFVIFVPPQKFFRAR
jgi:hypothetical protein